MSIYVVRHKDKHFLYLLKDEYHHMFIKYWKDTYNQNPSDLYEDLKKGIIHHEIQDVHKFDNPQSVAERYQAKRCVYSTPLWWYLDTLVMCIQRIPHN